MVNSVVFNRLLSVNAMHKTGLALMMATLALPLVMVVSLAKDRFITVASTTSTENSGLFDYLLPRFEEASGISVRVVALGTGKAVKVAAVGDADVLFVHHKPSEMQFVAEGKGVQRYDVMYNDFVIVGPGADPAGVSGGQLRDALQKIASSASVFVSRGDESGTHKKERALWQAAAIHPTGQWYRETGSGMGATLNVARGLGGYTLTDRATWLKFSNKGDMQIMVEDAQELINQYGVILVNPSVHPHVKGEDGQTFIQWLISKQGQTAINAYRIEGQQAFFANSAH